MQKRPAEPFAAAPSPVPLKKKTPVATTPIHLDLAAWEDATISKVFGVTLKVRPLFRTGSAGWGVTQSAQKEAAEQSGYGVVWLKPLADELQGEGSFDNLCFRGQGLTIGVLRRLLYAAVLCSSGPYFDRTPRAGPTINVVSLSHRLQETGFMPDIGMILSFCLSSRHYRHSRQCSSISSDAGGV